MSPRSKKTPGRSLYAQALRKVALAERLTAEEAREVRRRRLGDGSLPTPRPTDARQRLAFRHFDPRLIG